MPLTYQLVAGLGRPLGGRVRQVRIDRLVEDAYAATVEVEGPLGGQSVDARPSDVLNLAVLVDAPIFAAPQVLEEAEASRGSPGAGRLTSGASSPADDGRDIGDVIQHLEDR